MLVDSNSKDITVKDKDREEKIFIEINVDINIENIDIEEIKLVKENQNILVLINNDSIVINIGKWVYYLNRCRKMSKKDGKKLKKQKEKVDIKAKK